MQVNKSLKYGLVAIIIFVALFDLFKFYKKGGFEPKKSYGVEFNYRRGKMGIPQVERHWKDIEKKELQWLDTSQFHRSKIVSMDKVNGTNKEVDEFFFNPDSVLVHYAYYQRSNERADSCRCELKMKEKSKPIAYPLCKELMLSGGY